jgi:pilus assembly protein CpaE
MVSGEDVTRLLASLAREFRYVVVDTAPGLSEQTLAALDRATDVVMLSSMDVPGVRGLRKELDVLRELCMIPAGRHVVMNFADPKGGLSVRDVETTIGTGVDVVLPRSKAVPASTNQGVPLLQSGRRDPMAKELQRLVARFAATPLMKQSRYRAKHRAAS